MQPPSLPLSYTPLTWQRMADTLFWGRGTIGGENWVQGIEKGSGTRRVRDKGHNPRTGFTSVLNI